MLQRPKTTFFPPVFPSFARKTTPWSPQIADIWIRQHETDEFSYLQTEIETTYKIFFKKQNRVTIIEPRLEFRTLEANCSIIDF